MKLTLNENAAKKEKIKNWLEKDPEIISGKYVINDDLTVDVDGDVDIFRKTAMIPDKKLPVQFGKVTGDFSCTSTGLISLIGAPSEVGGDFDALGNQLTSLEYAPQKVGGDFECDHNQLESLHGAPLSVGGYFSCNDNKLTSLEGAPSKIGADFEFNMNPGITSLTGISKIIKQINGKIDFKKTPITHSILGLLRIKGLNEIDVGDQASEELRAAVKILSNHLEDRDAMQAQEEMFDAGLENFART